MTKCDLCGDVAKYDAKLGMRHGGCWANVCQACFDKYSLCAQLGIEPRIGFATVLKE